MTQIINKESQDLVFIETAGFSMWPFIRPGERLIIKKIPIEDLKIGDIILYRKDNQLVCHRLIKRIGDKKGYLLYTRGDNSSQFDSLSEEMFLGKAIGILKKCKMISLLSWERRFVNRVIVIIAPLFNIGIRAGKVLFIKK
jgi:signal peptidase I